MEKITSDLKEAESKQRSLSKSLDTIQSQASSLLLFSLQWKDLEDHLESIRAEVLTRFEEMKKEAETKPNELKEVEELIDQGKSSLNDLELSIELKNRELSRIVGEVDGKKKELSGIVGEVEEKRKQLGLQEEQYNVVRSAMKECDREIKVKEEKLTGMRRALKELDDKEIRVRAMDLKLEDNLVHMEKRKCRLEGKEKELGEKEKKLRVREERLEKRGVELAKKEREVQSKSEEVSLVEQRVMESLSEVEMKGKDFEEQKKTIEEQKRTIEERRKHLDSLSHKLKEKEWKLHKQGRYLKLEKQKLESMKKSMTVYGRVDGRGLQVLMIEQLKRIDSMSRKVTDVLQGTSDPAKLVLGAMQGFHRSNSDMMSREVDVDLEITRRSCILLLEELKRVSAEISSSLKEEALKLATEWKSKMAVTTEDRLEILGFLLLVTTYDLTSHYDAEELQSLLGKISDCKDATEFQALGISDKASELIIKDMEKESSLTKNAVTCLQPVAARHAKHSLGFVNEQLIWKQSIQHKIFVALDKSSNSNPARLLLDLIQVSFAGYWMKGVAGLEETALKSLISLLETVRTGQPNIGPQLKEDAIKLAVQWSTKVGADAENSLEILGFLLFIATYGLLSTFTTEVIAKLFGMISQHTHALQLCQTVGFADKFPVYIQDLVQNRKLAEAVRLICALKITDKFPLASLLSQYVDNSWNHCCAICTTKASLDDKDKVIDSEIAELRALMKCIKELNLESEYRSSQVEVQVDELRKLKEKWRHTAQSIASKSEPQELRSTGKKRKKRHCGRSTSTPMLQQQHQQQLQQQPQQQQQYNGDQLAAVPVARPPYPSSTCIASYQQPHPAPMLQTTYGIPGQFSYPPNGHIFAVNQGGHFMTPLNPGYPAPALVPAPTPVPMQGANVPYQFPHNNMMQYFQK